MMSRGSILDTKTEARALAWSEPWPAHMKPFPKTIAGVSFCLRWEGTYYKIRILIFAGDLRHVTTGATATRGGAPGAPSNATCFFTSRTRAAPGNFIAATL